MKNVNTKNVLLPMFTTLLILLSRFVYALEFIPTENEWLTWNEYCRARYVVSAAGKKSFSSFVRKYPLEKSIQWETQLGKAWYGLHHYCAAQIIMNRAAAEKRSNIKKDLFERVIRETEFTLLRTPEGHPMWPEMGVMIARANFKLGEIKEAKKFLYYIIEHNPTYPGSFSLLGMIYRKMSNSKKAIETFKEGIKRFPRNSGELHYFLGITYYEKGEYHLAYREAMKAKAQNYPMVWLLNKVRKYK